MTETTKVSHHALLLRERLTEEGLTKLLGRIWDEVLVPICKTNNDEHNRFSFVHSHVAMDYPCSEWRFQGMFGFGGKFRARSDMRWSVDHYPEDSTPAIRAAEMEANTAIARLVAEALAESPAAVDA